MSYLALGQQGQACPEGMVYEPSVNNCVPVGVVVEPPVVHSREQGDEFPMGIVVAVVALGSVALAAIFWEGDER